MQQDESVQAAADQEALEDAAFDAGFENDDQGPLDQPQESAAEPQAETQPSQPEEPAERPLTRAEFQAMADRAEALEAQLGKVHDKAFGKMGQLEQRIEQLKGMSSGLSPKARERLEEEFPELAEMLFDGLEAAQALPPAPPVDVDNLVSQKVQAKEEAIKQSLERRLLTRDHRDWEQVVQSSEFQQWVTTLPGDEQQQLVSTWDADFVSSKLTEFKAARKSPQPKDDATEKRNRRLEAALQPRGVSGPTNYIDDDEEAAMQKAFDG